MSINLTKLITSFYILIKNSRNDFSGFLVFTVLIATITLYILPLKSFLVPHFVEFHTAAETLCIGISFMIFTILHFLRNYTRSYQFKTLGIPFLGVGLIDLFHLLSYKGLSDFFTANSEQKSISFWLAARFLEALTLCYFSFNLDQKSRLNPKESTVYFNVLFYVTVITTLILGFPEILPNFVDYNFQITPTKIGLEYLLILIHLILGLYLIHYQQKNSTSPRTYYLTTASFIIAISGLCFSSFTNGHDVLIFLGHVLKVLAYYCILKACLQTELLEPYVKMIQLNQEMKQQNENIRLIQSKLSRAEKMSLVGINVSTIVHDLNNMLMISNLSARKILELVTEQESSDKIKVFSEKLIKSLDKSQNIQKLILNQTRESLENEMTVSFDSIFESLTPLLKVLAGSQNNLILNFEKNLFAKANQVGLEQILMNLTVNAKDALTDHPGEIAITVKKYKNNETKKTLNGIMPAGHYVFLSVKDNGIGMTSEVASHIFETFYTTKKEGQGTGLGLSTVLDRLNKWNAYIELETQINLGSEFKIYLQEEK